MPEKKSPTPLDLSNEDVVRKVLEEGAPDDLRQFLEHAKITPEYLDLLVEIARLRKKSHQLAEQQLKQRLEQGPSPTVEELAMGCFQESLEPQVRSTVVRLRQKGYNTYISGFSGFDRQEIRFKNDGLKDFKFPDELAKQLETQGVTLETKPDSVSFTCHQFLNLGQLEKIWRQIENALPDLQRSAEPCPIKTAKIFREKYKM